MRWFIVQEFSIWLNLEIFKHLHTHIQITSWFIIIAEFRFAIIIEM